MHTQALEIDPRVRTECKEIFCRSRLHANDLRFWESLGSDLLRYKSGEASTALPEQDQEQTKGYVINGHAGNVLGKAD